MSIEEGRFDHRSAEQLKADQAGVRRQVRALGAGAATEQFDMIVERMMARQQTAPAEHAVPFDRLPVTGEAGRPEYVLVARGELLVRQTTDEPRPPGLLRFLRPSPEPADRLLRRFGYTAVTEGDDVRDKRTRVYRGDKRGKELQQDIQRLNSRGVRVAPNRIVPLGWIIKADDYPTATTGPGAYPPPNAVGAAAAPDVRVAVIDTGIVAAERGDDWLDGVHREPDNIDLLDILPDNGSGQGDGRLDWSAGHGQFAAGVVQQVAPDVEIMAYRFTRSDGLGTEKDAAEAMIRAAQDAARDGKRLIINASLGTPALDGVPPIALADAVQLITDSYPDVLIVAAAGNDGTAAPIYPAAFPSVVAVGALNYKLRPAPFSSFGPWVTCSAVGVGVVSTFAEGTMPPETGLGVPDVRFPADAWAVWTGTSFSAPQISGEVARRCQETPGLQPRDALAALLANTPVEPGYGNLVRLLAGTPV